MNFHSCLVIVNSKSTQSAQAVEQLTVLNTYFSKKTIRHLTLNKRDFTSNERISDALKNLPPNSLVVIIGGDGTIHLVVNALLRLHREHHETLTMLPLKAGNASDIAHMLHGEHSAELETILLEGTRRRAIALELQQSNQETKYVLAYASFGASAAVMEYLDGLSRRYPILGAHPLLLKICEAVITPYALMKTPRFLAERDDSTSSKYYDVMFINGSRIAKYGRTRAKLTRSEFARITVRHKYPLLFWYLWKLFQHHRDNNTTQATQSILFKQAVPAQIDGEVYAVPADTRITIAKEVQPYFVLSCTPN